MRPANIYKLWSFLKIYRQYAYFFQLFLAFDENLKVIFFTFFNAAARPFFESHAARESL